MKNYLIDTHAHLDMNSFDSDGKEIQSNNKNVEENLALMKEYGVEKVIIPSVEVNTLDRVVEISNMYENVFSMVGIFPSEAKTYTDEVEEKLIKLAQNKKVVAVGEVGLDYYWEDNPERDIQKKWFRAQLDLAKELNLPVVIHSRDAAEDTLNILTEYFTGKSSGEEDAKEMCPGVMHCYSYSLETAEQLMKTGLYFGIGGVVTYKNAKKLVRAVEAIPIERIVLETDCPYLTPTPKRGERNYSGYLIHVIEKLAEIKGLTPDEVADITWENAKRLYRLEKL